MSMFMKGKKYGLIMPSGKKAAAVKPVAKPSAFGDSSSDEEDDGKRQVNASLKREHAKSKKQMEEAASQALAEDPSIFEYDSLYDQMVEEKKKKAQNLSSERKPKYIHTLKKAAERRKLEGELVYEHLAQKEIEKDAEEFRDKESFVTSAYKKKLEERRQLEEELAREAALEEANDVTKQKDLSRFQKHLFNQIASSGVPGESRVKQPQSTESREKEQEDRGSGGSNQNEREAREGMGEKRRSSETQRREGGGRERRHSSEGGRERERRDSNRRSRGEKERRDSRGEERERRNSERDRSSRDRDGRHYGERAERRESKDKGVIPESEMSSTDDKPMDTDAHKTEKNEEGSAPPKKRIRIRAGVEVEEEDVTPVERRKLAAAKKATEETMVSAKERYLARKRAKTEAGTGTRKHSTSDD
jgi:coiled-coil domain-containing protein 55